MKEDSVVGDSDTSECINLIDRFLYTTMKMIMSKVMAKTST